MSRRAAVEQLTQVLRQGAGALARLALQAVPIHGRTQHDADVIDSAYRVVHYAGMQTYLVRAGVSSPQPRETGWYGFDATAPKSARDQRTLHHARVTFLEGVYDGWLDTAVQDMHRMIETHLQEEV